MPISLGVRPPTRAAPGLAPADEAACATLGAAIAAHNRDLDRLRHPVHGLPRLILRA